MYKEIVSKFPYTNLIIIAFIIFLSLFIIMLIWIFRKENNDMFNEVSQSCLKDGIAEEKHL